MHRLIIRFSYIVMYLKIWILECILRNCECISQKIRIIRNNDLREKHYQFLGKAVFRYIFTISRLSEKNFWPFGDFSIS